MASNEKLLNTKLAQNFEIYNFRFRQKFIWGFVWKTKFETWVHLKRYYMLRNSNFSPIFVWQLEKLWTQKLFVFWKPITLVLGKSSFELYFRNYFQSRLVWNLTDKLNLWTLRFNGPVILCLNFYFLSLTSTRLWFNMILERHLFIFICILTLI